MSAYFCRISDYGKSTMNIIDEKTLIAAENGENYLDAEDYNFLCEANSIEEADKYYWEVEFNEYVGGLMAERDHP